MASAAPAKQTASNLVAAYAAHIKGKVVLTTGVSPSGLGAHFVKVLAAGGLPSLLILAGRNLAKVQETAKEIASAAAAGEGGEGAGEGGGVQVRVLELDLTSMDAVRAAADTVNKWTDVPQIDVLVNNAGVMGTEWSRTPEGFENQLATNHLGPFLFTNLIMSKLTKSPAPRVVTISSEGHRMSPIRFADPNFQDGALYNKWQAYGQSKTANILFGVELARRLGAKNHLSAFSVSPGAVKTKLSSHLDWSKEFAAASKCISNPSPSLPLPPPPSPFSFLKPVIYDTYTISLNILHVTFYTTIAIGLRFRYRRY